MKKNIYFFNTYLGGGAANAAINIYNCISEAENYRLNFFHRNDLPQEMEHVKPSTYDEYVKYNPEGYQKGLINRVQSSIKYRYQNYIRPKYLNNRPTEFELFAFVKQYYQTPITKFGKLPDLIHLHWISGWLDYPSFFKSIPNHIPIVWTLHDMNPFTGGCHYSIECTQYKEKNCRQCYQLNSYKNGNIAKKNWNDKFRALKNKNLHIIGNSSWTTKEAESSLLFKYAKSFQTFNLSIDTAIFKPLKNSYNTLKKVLATSQNTFIVVLGAHDVDNPRKGIIEFLKAADNESINPNIRFVTFGGSQLNQTFKNIQPIHLGKLDRDKLCQLYNSADLMVVPSLYEAFGLTAIEAMACGTPVLGFDQTGLDDTVINNQTGWLMPNGNFEMMTKKIIFLAKTHHKTEKSINDISQFIQTNLSRKKEKELYVKLYASILI